MTEFLTAFMSLWLTTSQPFAEKIYNESTRMSSLVEDVVELSKLDSRVPDPERIGDHCSNLGIALLMNYEEIHDKHDRSNAIEIFRSESFSQYRDEYIKKFGLNDTL